MKSVLLNFCKIFIKSRNLWAFDDIIDIPITRIRIQTLLIDITEDTPMSMSRWTDYKTPRCNVQPYVQNF